jgi:hypothetical protein
LPRVDCPRPKRTLIAGMPSPHDLKVDAQGVYWISGDVLYRLREGETKADEIAVVSGRHRFALDEDYVFFGRDTGAERCAIMRVKRDGSLLAPVVEDQWCDDFQKPWVVLDGDRLYYVEILDASDLGVSVSVLKVGGGRIASELPGPFQFDGDYMYWLSNSSGTAFQLYRSPKGSTRWSDPFEFLGSWSYDLEWLQLDGDRVFLSRTYRASISALPTTPTDGGGSRCADILVWGESGSRVTPLRFVADARSLYWVDSNGSDVWKAPRTGGMAARVLGGSDAAVMNYGDMALMPTRVFIANLTDGAIDVFDR